MKITKQHIENLYQFTRQHYVEYYDVQTELVDHLANDIEQIWIENPNLSFEEATNQSFKKFGVFGFMEVLEAKQKQMNKRYVKLVLGFIKEWFQLPKIILTVLIFYSFFYFLKLETVKYFLYTVIFTLIIIDFIKIYRTNKIFKKRKKANEKIFLLEYIINVTQHSYGAILLLNGYHMFDNWIENFAQITTYKQYFIAGLFTFLFIFFYIVNHVIPKKADNLLKKVYPAYKILKNL